MFVRPACFVLSLVFFCTVYVFLTDPLAQAQDAAARLITKPVDDKKLQSLPGSVHPLTRVQFDRGAVPNRTPATRLLLMLQRPPDREAALKKFVQDVHTRGNSKYHRWLSPQQFGERFGASDADIQTAVNWLDTQGFVVQPITQSKTHIEFSGTVGQLQKTFHTEIHEYEEASGERHYANSQELRIPEALAQLIRGVSPLNNFRAKPQVRSVGRASYSRATRNARPAWTLPGSNDTKTVYALAPTDFATQYNLLPLYSAGVTGVGQTIGIINESNIDLSLVKAYRALFSLSENPVELVIDGNDPGTLDDVAVEAYLDVEVAGSVAPNATVNLYISSGSLLQDPLYLAALRAVEDNQASVLSVSFSACEGFLGQSGNQLWSGLWEQASAQGQTVLVSSGDSGSAACDDGNNQYIVGYGLAVNGLASTPWNVAVGGTDFFYDDYASGGSSISSLWNQTNDPTLGSLKSPLPEQPWDTAYGLNLTGPYVQSIAHSIPAAGGGASSCIDSASSSPGSSLPFVCIPDTATLRGYRKPSWQNVTGVPADGVRDIPDVSLFSANGTNLSAYPICAIAGDCVTSGDGRGQIQLVGGTSASTPAMAAIMALVNQKYGRQGQANFSLYALASQKPAAFHDVIRGSNNVPCLENSPDCTLDTNGDTNHSLQKYAATPSYDLATGLGSIDANALLNGWNSIVFHSTSTTLQISPSSFPHGAPVSLSIKVTSSGEGIPQGDVAIVTNSTDRPSAPLAALSLDSEGKINDSVSLAGLPAGTYQIRAKYAGDGKFAPSQSELLTITVSPESSILTTGAFAIGGSLFNPVTSCQSYLPPFSGVTSGATGIENGTSISLGTALVVSARALGATSQTSSPSGVITFSFDNQVVSTLPLAADGAVSWEPSQTAAAGFHTISATYSGDNTYSPSTALPLTYSLTKAQPELSVWPAANCTTTGLFSDNPVVTTCSFTADDSLVVGVRLQTQGCRFPTGPVNVSLGSLSKIVILTPGPMGPYGVNELNGMVKFTNIPEGTYSLSATYDGDANFQPATSIGTLFGDTAVTVASPGALTPTTTTLGASPSSFAWGGVFSFAYTIYTVTVTAGPDSSLSPTGKVTVFNDGGQSDSLTLLPAGPNSATATSLGPIPSTSFDFGQGQILAVYSGDPLYKSSASEPLDFNFVVPSPAQDFTLVLQSSQVMLPTGSSKTIGINLGVVGAFSGAVNLMCTPSSINVSCSLNPTTVVLNGATTATLTISASARTASSQWDEVDQPFTRRSFTGIELGSILGILLCLACLRLRKTMLIPAAGVLILISFSNGCGGSGKSSPPVSPPPTQMPSATYSVVVTGTSQTRAHNAKFTVVVVN